MDYEITKREIIFSIVIFLVCLCGLICGTAAIDQACVGLARPYELANTFTKDQFDFAKETDSGLSYCEVELQFTTPAVADELSVNGNYVYIYVEREHKETYTETYEDSDGETHTRTETRWVTDYVHTYYGGDILINGYAKPASDFYIDSPSNILDDLTEKVIEGYEVSTSFTGSYAEPKGFLAPDYRYTVRGKSYEDFYDSSVTNSIGVVFKDNDFTPEESSLSTSGKFVIEKKTAEELKAKRIESAKLKKTLYLVLLWVFGILLTAGIIFMFVLIDNRWLEEK